MGGETPVLHPDVQAILDAIEKADRGPGHGHCGLPICITAALGDGLDVFGAEVAAMIVQRVGKPKHGFPIGPCKSCEHLVEYYDLRFLTGENGVGD